MPYAESLHFPIQSLFPLDLEGAPGVPVIHSPSPGYPEGMNGEATRLRTRIRRIPPRHPVPYGGEHYWKLSDDQS